MARIRVGGNVHIERVTDMDLVRPAKRSSSDPGRADRLRDIRSRIRSNPRWRGDPPKPKIERRPKPDPTRRLKNPRVVLTDKERAGVGRWLRCYILCPSRDRHVFIEGIRMRYRGASGVVLRKILREAREMNGSNNGGPGH